MDEEELEYFESIVFGDDPFRHDSELYPLKLHDIEFVPNQIWDENGPVPGCYHVLPADME